MPRHNMKLSAEDWELIETGFLESQEEMLECIEELEAWQKKYKRLKEQCKCDFWAKKFDVSVGTVRTHMQNKGISHYSQTKIMPSFNTGQVLKGQERRREMLETI